ncbi:MAG: tetratricopeptide repeat protein [bacterium]|nr:sel1 repeat family protein [Gammaproteobacteria bacterium]
MQGEFRWTLSVALLSLTFSSVAVDFGTVQKAAKEGRFREVVQMLSEAIDAGELTPEEAIVAYSNRGIAYSLLDANGLARQDLYQVLKWEPENKLALNHMGLLSEQVDQDYRQAAEYYQQGVALDYAASQVNLANLYVQGLGIDQNYVRAFSLYEAAAEKRYSLAYLPLGNLYFNGQGTQTNLRVAMELYTQAADAGVVAAHYPLGIASETGKGSNLDLTAARNHYRKAAEGGHAEAQNALGYLYRQGIGVPRNMSEAALWYEKAADQGIVEAKNRLSWILSGCPTDNVCDGLKALQLAKEALEVQPSPGYQDSLAAAYARLGRFDLAINTMEQMIEKLPQDAPYKTSYQRRLSSYRLGIPHQL